MRARAGIARFVRVDAFDASLLIAASLLPFHALLQWQLHRLADPAELRRQGVVIVRNEILSERAAPVGSYMGQPIWASVRFMGMTYRFDRVQHRRNRERLRPGELFIEPGLVYVTR
jgi:hypothetical protein